MNSTRDSGRTPTERNSMTRSLLPYYVGAPIVAAIYTAVLLWMRASGWFGKPYAEAGHVGQIAFKVIFTPARFIGKMLHLRSFLGSLVAILLTGLLVGVVMVWTGCALRKMCMHRKTAQQSPAGDVLKAAPEE